MDYQASKSSFKEVGHTGKKSVKRVASSVLIGVVLLHSFAYSYADDPAPNPLIENITITATVLQNPGVNPDTPPTSPGPVNMTEVTDIAIFKGIAYPLSTISLIKSGVVVAEIPANQNGLFDIRVRNLLPGTYSFGIRANDKNGLQSKLLMFTIYISSSVATIVEGIFIPPTITSDKVDVKRGEPITFSGYSTPNAEIRLSLSSTFELLKRANANASGTWSYVYDSSELDFGDYNAKARSLTATNLSPYSDALAFSVSSTTRMRSKLSSLAGFRKRCDLNDDNRVNLLDFSIMAFWYKRITFPPKVDLNSDNAVNLTDLSILAYCWTG